jgi:hypothetical protein
VTDLKASDLRGVFFPELFPLLSVTLALPDSRSMVKDSLGYPGVQDGEQGHAR